MASPSIRPAFGTWPANNRALRDVVAEVTPEQLALQPTPERWPLWATIGHLACQRVFWLCDFAGEPGAATTPFPNAGSNCPGDDDLEHVLGPKELAEALDSTFRIVEGCLDRWTLEMLDDEVSRVVWGPGRVHTRGWILQRVFAHDVYHTAEVNEALSRAGLAIVDIWD
jgi:uncharacterized damage-inducible protein DinB